MDVLQKNKLKLISELPALLLDHFGPAGWWPLTSRAGQDGFDARGYHPGLFSFPKTPLDRLEICIGAILTQNTAWRNVETALGNLVSANALTVHSLLNLPIEELARLVRPAGYYNQKAIRLHTLAQFCATTGCLEENRVPERETLLTLKGVGPETADSMLLYAWNKPVAVVDAYTIRIFSRLGINLEATEHLTTGTKGSKQYYDVQYIIQSRIPLKTDILQEFHAHLVMLAAEYCKTKPRCTNCPFTIFCPKLDCTFRG